MKRLIPLLMLLPTLASAQMVTEGWTLKKSVLDTYSDATEGAAPSAPTAGSVRVYGKSGEFCAKSSANVETCMSAGGGGGGIAAVEENNANVIATGAARIDFLGADFDVATDGATEADISIASGAVLRAWPIGSVFISVVSTSPATLLGGGTWVAIGAGRVLVGLDSGDTAFDVAEEPGGAYTVASSNQTFTGTASTVIVNHTHTVTNNVGTTDGTFGTYDSSSTSPGTAKTSTTSDPNAGGAASYTPVGTNAAGAATSVVQPYLVVYMWKRTA